MGGLGEGASVTASPFRKPDATAAAPAPLAAAPPFRPGEGNARAPSRPDQTGAGPLSGPIGGSARLPKQPPASVRIRNGPGRIGPEPFQSERPPGGAAPR